MVSFSPFRHLRSIWVANQAGSWVLLLLFVSAVSLVAMVVAGALWLRVQVHAPDTLYQSGTLAGLEQRVIIARDDVGIPRIRAENTADLMKALGWVMAEDRLSQMLGLRLLAEGRMAELAGRAYLGSDILMRGLRLPEHAAAHWQGLSEEARQELRDFSDGVNAFLQQRGSHGLVSLSPYQPEPWSPQDALKIQLFLAHALSLNLSEELLALALWSRLSPELLPWLLPVYPDEALNHEEVRGLRELTAPALMASQLSSPGSPGFFSAQAASNNWALAPFRTRGGMSILANDTHLLLTEPALWMPVNLQSPGRRVAGLAIPGSPLVIAGTNGSVAWGMTMVMADTQDLVLERLIERSQEWWYETEDGWEKAEVKREIFYAADAEPQVFELLSTRHGPLINTALSQASPVPLQPPAVFSEYGLALQHILALPSQDYEGFRQLNLARNLNEAWEASERIHLAPLNLLLADAGHIAWRVTGSFPQRGWGRGQFPRPGWLPGAGWKGIHPRSLHPASRSPESGQLATANHRSVAAGKAPFVLSSSWYAPERIERIEEVLGTQKQFDREQMLALQVDQYDGFFGKWRERWLRNPARRALLKAALRQQAPEESGCRETLLDRFSAWDGRLSADSGTGAAWGMFTHHLQQELFADELGPADGALWRHFTRLSAIRYSALQDHMLKRDGSPFWDNLNTPHPEKPAEILAGALTKACVSLQAVFGNNPWSWGELHRIHWRSGPGESLDWQTGPERIALKWIASQLDRGPYPVGGNRYTVNVAGYSEGLDFKVWNVPAMRMLVDFSQPEPLLLSLASGQNEQPGPAHYESARSLWLNQAWQKVPLSDFASDSHYTDYVQWLKPAVQADP